MRVEVVYALADVQEIVVLELPKGTAARDALAASGILARHGLSAAQLRLGIAGKRASPDSSLRDGDRIEILRPLALDPNEARRKRARKSRV